MIELWDCFWDWFATLSRSDKIGLAGVVVGLVGLIGIPVGIVGIYLPLRDARRARKEAEGRANNKIPEDVRLRLLEKIRKTLVGLRLRQGLREAIRVDLGLIEMPDAVSAKLREFAVLGAGTLKERPISGSIDEIFEGAGRQLLILGEPGTGKTNLLMELAQHLVSEANQYPSAPIPVIFSLPSWTLQRDVVLRYRSLSKWMQDDLTKFYQIAPATAKILVEHDLIVPLLDGLDEVAEDRRADCVREIGKYQKERNLGSLVVCCRLAEFEKLPKLDLGVAVRVEKLSRQDVEREIAKPGLEYVKRALDRDPELWSIVDTPLWMHVLYGAAMVDADVGKEANPRDRLYARYVNYVISRTSPESPRVRTTPDLLQRWLGSLAVWMQRVNQVDLVVGDLDFLFLVSQQGVWARGFIPWLTAGLAAGAIGGREVGFAVGLGAVAASRVSQAVLEIFAPRLRFGRRVGIGTFLNTTPMVIGYGLLATLVGTWFHGVQSGLVMGFRFGLVALIFGAVSGPAWGLLSYSVDRRTFHSVSYFLLDCLITVLPLLLFIPLQLMRFTLNLTPIAISLAVGLVASSFVSFVVGPYPVLFWLWLRGRAPLRYVRFLNEAAERLLLIRGGESFKFFHITFRDYMAHAHGPRRRS